MISLFIRKNFVKAALAIHYLSGVPSTVEVERAGEDVASWQFDNGSVAIPHAYSIGGKVLASPRLLGSGGGGAVFAMTNKLDEKERFAVKVSWKKSTQSVENECRVLQSVQKEIGPLETVEQCLAIEVYPSDSQRVVLLLQPVFEDSTVSSISELPSRNLQVLATEAVTSTLVRLLAANVVVTDVQLLISKDSPGSILFIDFSEARLLSTPQDHELGLLDRALMNNFIQEVAAMIPESMRGVASTTVSSALQDISQSKSLPKVRDEARDALEDQLLLR